MNGQTLTKGFVLLSGGATAVYNSSGLAYYHHAEWLGSSRFASLPTGTSRLYYDGACAPYGENYAESGTTDRVFAGMGQDTVSSSSYPLYDALYREYHPTWGRWVSPDPAGLGAVDPTNPQSWNRYAYVTNNPLALTDPLGLADEDCTWDPSTNTLSCPSPPSVDRPSTVNPDDPYSCAFMYVCPNYPSMSPWAGEGQVTSSGGSTGGGNGSNNQGGAANNAAQTIKSAVCSALPAGRTTGVSGGIGGIGGQTGSLELVVNYQSGQVSGFASAGLQLGWNGGAQGSVFTGFIYWDLGANNSGYSGGFTSLSANAGVGGSLSVSSGGLNGPTNFRPVSVAALNLGTSLVPGPTGTASATNYTQPLSLGKFWALSNPLDLTLFLAAQVCK